MRQHRRFLIGSLVFFLILAVLIVTLTWVFLPKAFFSQDWPATSTTANFYKLKRDSVDVLFLGSSRGQSTFIPQLLYDEYGLTSYNLSTEQQSILVSYYWLKEALRFQHPQAVVLETYFCFHFKNNLVNSGEGHVRQAIDPMQWSPVKVEAVAAICELDDSHTLSSYYNPLERFHARWSSLNEDDFTFMERLSHGGMMGYGLLPRQNIDADWTYFTIDPSVDPEPLKPSMQEYLDKIVALCEENSIALILVSTPYTEGTQARYNAMESYAESHGLQYFDFNEETLYNEIGYDYSADSYDVHGHSNYWGAQKVTDKLGQILTGPSYGLSGGVDEQWEDSRDFYQAAARNAQLAEVDDLAEYLQAIDNKQYTVFISVKDEAASGLDESVAAAMADLGLSYDRVADNASYFAVISEKGVQEESGSEALAATGTFRDGRSTYKIESAGQSAGNNSSIVVDGQEYSRNEPGLNIVVYDNLYRKVVDSVSFDMLSSETRR